MPTHGPAARPGKDKVKGEGRQQQGMSRLSSVPSCASRISPSIPPTSSVRGRCGGCHRGREGGFGCFLSSCPRRLFARLLRLSSAELAKASGVRAVRSRIGRKGRRRRGDAFWAEHMGERKEGGGGARFLAHSPFSQALFESQLSSLVHR